MNSKNLVACLIFLSLTTLISCTKKEKPTEPNITELMRKSFVQKHFVMRMETDKYPSKIFDVYYKDGKKDSIYIRSNLYKINFNKNQVKLQNLILLNLDSINDKERILRMTHIKYPSLTTKITGYFTFIFKNNQWNLIKHSIIIADGRFTLSEPG